jgi:hypothetical protein
LALIVLACEQQDANTRRLVMEAKTLIAILGKRLGARPPGWEEVAPTHPTLGDVDSDEARERYQAGKRAHKAAMRAAGKRA